MERLVQLHLMLNCYHAQAFIDTVLTAVLTTTTVKRTMCLVHSENMLER